MKEFDLIVNRKPAREQNGQYDHHWSIQFWTPSEARKNGFGELFDPDDNPQVKHFVGVAFSKRDYFIKAYLLKIDEHRFTTDQKYHDEVMIGIGRRFDDDHSKTE